MRRTRTELSRNEKKKECCRMKRKRSDVWEMRRQRSEAAKRTKSSYEE